jgi:hypothetical protein
VEKFTQYRLGWECNGEVLNYSTFATNDFEIAKSLIEEERLKINNDVEVSRRSCQKTHQIQYRKY